MVRSGGAGSRLSELFRCECGSAMVGRVERIDDDPNSGGVGVNRGS